MIFIVLSVIQSVLILVTFKLFDRLKIDNLQAIVANYIVAATFGYLIFFTTHSPDHLTTLPHGHLTPPNWLPIAILLGSMFICTFFFFALSSQKVGVAVTSVTSKISLVIPVIASVFLFEERLNWIRVTGIGLAIAAFYLTFKQKEKHSWALKYAWLPFLVFAGNGIIDTTMKYADHHFIKDDLVFFLAVVFSTAFLIGLTALIFSTVKHKSRISGKNVAGGIFLGLINFGSTYYMLKAINTFESSVVFPVTNASIVGLSALAGYFGFREKLSLVNWSGIILALAAILVIANA